MKKTIKKFLMGAAITLLSFSSVVTFAGTQIKVNVNGSNVKFDTTQPKIIGAVTYVPLRGVFESLGFQVAWNGKERTISLKDKAQEFIINSKTNRVTGSVEKTLQNEVVILDNSTMLPLREVSQLVGAQVNWDQKTATITIASQPVATVSEDEREYLRNAYAISEAKAEQSLEIELLYIDGYTYGDVVEGKNEEFAEKYAAIHGDFSEYEALRVPASMQELHKEIIALRKMRTEVTVDLILNGHTDKHQEAWEAYIAQKDILDEKFEKLYAANNIDVEETFGIDIFSRIPLV